MELWQLLLEIAGGVLILIFVWKCIFEPKFAIALFVATIIFTQPLGGEFIPEQWLSRITVSELAGGVLLVSLVVQMLSRRQSERFKMPGFFSAWLLFLGLCIASQLWFTGGSQTVSIPEVLAISYLGMIFFALAKLIRTEQDLKNAMESWMFTALMLFLLGVWEIVALFASIPHLFQFGGEGNYRIALTFRNNGQLGAYCLVTTFVIMAYSALPGISRKRQFVAYMTAGLGLLVLFFSSKRSAIMGLGVGLTAVAYYAGQRNRISRKLVLLPLFALVIFLGAINYSEGFRDFASWRADTLEGQIYERKFVRTNWGGALSAFSEHPFVGVGYGGFQGSVYDETHSEVHSTPLRVLAELGILGSLPFLVFQLLQLWAGVKVTSNRPRTIWGDAGGFLVAGLIAIFVSQTYHLHYRNREYWVMLALLAVIVRLHQRSLAMGRATMNRLVQRAPAVLVGGG